MLGQITVKVDMPATNAPTVTTVPPSSPVAPAPSSLPFTGFDLTATLGVAAVLLAVGHWFVQAARRQGRETTMRLHRSRMRLVLGAGAALFVLAALALPGGAQVQTQGTTVKANGPISSRLFFVEDLAGNPLTTLTLPSTGALQPFRVRVVDRDVLSATATGFSVDARLNNLYLKNGTFDYATKINSADVRLGFLTNPVDGLLGAIGVQSLFGLSGQLSCASITTQINGILGSVTDPTATTAALSTLCSTLGTGTNAFNNTAVAGTVYSITPTVTGLANLPFSLAGQDPGPFTNPDFGNGIGAADPNATATAPTQRGILTALRLSTLPQTLLDNLFAQLGSAVGALPDMSVDGVNAKAKVGDVIAALQSSTDPAVQQYGTLLNTLAGSQAVAQVEGLVNYALNLLPVSVSSLGGTYFAFPGLALTSPPPVPGGYEGTLTVTFVQS